MKKNLSKKTMENEITFLSKKILELNKKLMESQNAKTLFLSLIANQLNNPMTAILGILPHIKIQKDEKNEKNFYLIAQEALSLNFKIQNLLAVAEIESGNVDISYASVDVQEILDEVLISLKYLIEDRNIKIDIKNSLNHKIVTDPKKIYLILKNLISNGCEYGLSDKTIEIIINENNNRLLVAIKNQGDAPKVNYKSEIFTRFADSMDGKKGLGIGLSIIREFCELLDGSVDYEAVDGFVTFKIDLAIKEELQTSDAFGFDEFLFSPTSGIIEL